MAEQDKEVHTFYYISCTEHSEHFKKLMSDAGIVLSEIVLDRVVIDPKNESEFATTVQVLHDAISKIPRDANIIFGMDRRIVYETELRLACFSLLSKNILCVILGTDDSVLTWVQDVGNVDTLRQMMDGHQAVLVPLFVAQEGTKMYHAYMKEVLETQQQLISAVKHFEMYAPRERDSIDKQVVSTCLRIIRRVTNEKSKSWERHLIKQNALPWTRLFEEECKSTQCDNREYQNPSDNYGYELL